MNATLACRAVVLTIVIVALGVTAQAYQQPFPDSHTVDGSADGATSVVTADFDRDGDMDIAATVRWDGLVSWWENPGWTEHVVATGFTQAHHLVAADMNGDGWPDLVAGNRGTASANLVWYQNPGPPGGAWTAHDVSGSGLINGVLGLAVGDIEGDGCLDIAVAGFKTGFSDGIVMWFQNSCGSIFYAHDVDLALPVAHSVAIGDVDGDGRNELVAASYDDDKVVWYRRTGSHPGSSWERHQIATGIDGANHVMLHDFDGDRDLDVAACAYNGDEVVWFENVDWADSWTEHSLGTVDGPYDLDAVDLDRDGDVDIVGTGRVDGTLHWWETSTPGYFMHRTSASGLTGARSSAVADLDGDGDLDVAVAADTSKIVAWFENGATRRTAKLATDSLPCSLLFVDITDIEIADVDADGHLDFVAAIDDTDDLLIGLWTGSGYTCSYEDVLPAAGPAALFVDESRYFAMAGEDGSLARGYIRYSETFGLTVTSSIVNDSDPFPGASDAVLVDLDGDDDLDVVAVSPTESRIAWWRSESMTSPTYHWIANLSGAVSVRAADIDRDSDQDLAVIATGGTVAWFENDDGDGLSWTTHNLGLLAGGVAMRIGDVNADGWPDLVAAGDGADEIRWWENLGLIGGSILWTPRTVALLDNPGTLELADLDRDGALDAVVSRPDAGTLAWVRNYGWGLTWAALAIPGTWADVVDVAVGDVLTDGYPDLLVAERSWGTLAALGNRGGQYTIGAAPLAPDFLQPNETVQIFRLTPGHLGRSGDLALELRSFNFHVDDGVTPLTTPQLRSVFSSISVYFDANENFVFDGGDWSLAVDTSPSTDAGGDMRIEVASNVFNPSITHGQSPTFFVVAQTTADPDASVEGIRLLHQWESWPQLWYEDYPNMSARAQYFSDTSSGLMITNTDLIFANGFESGGSSDWSATVP